MCSAGSGLGSGETELDRTPPFCSLAPRDSAIWTGRGQVCTPLRWPRRPVWRVGGTERGGLDPASSNGGAQGGVAGGTFELRVNGSAYHRSMASDHVGPGMGS